MAESIGATDMIGSEIEALLWRSGGIAARVLPDFNVDDGLRRTIPCSASESPDVPDHNTL